MGLENPKYPSTPHWPWSPTIGRGDVVHRNPERFVDRPVVATEKLDGGCTLLHAGRVYARSGAAPSEAEWMAMVKKHHAWKVTEPDVWLYGEDIYGVHSINHSDLMYWLHMASHQHPGRTLRFLIYGELRPLGHAAITPVPQNFEFESPRAGNAARRSRRRAAVPAARSVRASFHWGNSRTDSARNSPAKRLPATLPGGFMRGGARVSRRCGGRW